MHGVSPLLSRTLIWRGPDHWVEFLDQQRGHTLRRHSLILGLLDRLDRCTREAGIPALALKGAALHANGVYTPGERPMADVDILVRPRDSQRAASLLESLGFEESCVSWKERVFSPVGAAAVAGLGEHSDNHLKIELHERVCEKLPKHITDLSADLFPQDFRPGLNAYPSTAALMLHLLLHAAGSMVFRALRLLQLHDLALLSRHMTSSDWDELRERVVERRLWWALPPMQMACRYYSLPVPANVAAALGAACPKLLTYISRRQTLSDVSFSHVWVDAFPGIEWSQSLPKMMGYMADRIRPTAENFAIRENNLKNQAWAPSGAWSAMSQSRRILRWVTSRQTRPVSTHAVRAALEQRR
jgi:hypothetical protein